jgi:uncharacterized membrane protein
MDIGRRVYGLGAIALGVVSVIFPEFGVGQPLPAHLPAHDVIVYGSASLLMLGGLVVNLPRMEAAGAAGLALLYALWAVVMNGPHLVAHPGEVVSWESIGEIVAMAAGGVVAYGVVTGAGANANAGRAANIARAGRIMFGLCLLVFGAAHFAYAKFTASLVPTWLPLGGLFWTYATGVAAIAAGLAILSGIQARLAAILLTVMYALFGLLVHSRLILADPHAHGNWTEFVVNLVLMSVAWTVADSIGRKAAPDRP